jgi:hypothetical protein
VVSDVQVVGGLLDGQQVSRRGHRSSASTPEQTWRP